MSARQFEEWIAYYLVEPFGDQRADLRNGVLAALIANVHRDPEKMADPFLPGDFILRLIDGASDKEPEDPDAGWKRNKLLFEQLATHKEA